MTYLTPKCLAITSLLFLSSGIYAFIHGVYAFTALSVITASVSANYWRNPVFGYARVLDLVFSKVSFAIYFVTGCTYLHDTTVLPVAIVVCGGIVHCYFMSNHLHSFREPRWLYYHAVFHCLVAIEQYIVVGAYIYFLKSVSDASASPTVCSPFFK